MSDTEQIGTKHADGFSLVGTAGGNSRIVQTATATTANAATNLFGIRAKTSIPTAITSAGNNYGVYIETEALGTATCTGEHGGLKIETYVESGATLSNGHFGAFIATYSEVSGSQHVNVIRLEHNGATVAGAFIGVFNQTQKVSYLLESSMTAELWCGVTSTVTIANGGWLRIKLGGNTRYIALGSTIS
jgi:hypothetical protein